MGHRILLSSFLLSFFFLGTQGRAAEIIYKVSFPMPQTHYVEVEMEISGIHSGEVKLLMPVWAPGSYLVREFARHVEGFSAAGAGGRALKHVKTTKDTWTVNCKGETGIRVKYSVYANELSVRTSFVDQEHAYLNGTSIFLYVPEFKTLPCKVKVTPHKEWKQISVALDRSLNSDPFTFQAGNYDQLVDAPFEIGNHRVFYFNAAGVPHEVAMFGEGNYDTTRLKNDMARIVEECTSVFGEHPCKRYVFIIHNLSSGGGGLEHENSTTLQTSRWSYGSETSYQGFLSLVAHEYFHLWNVKRLRPVPLGPFDYGSENYTTLLWLSEGFTAYYDDLITYRSGFYSEAEYLKALAGNFSYCNNIKGAAYQTLSEASTEAWVKFYRPHENSSNTTVSYYTKGAAVGALIDMEIIRLTGGKKKLDDVFREMYALYYKKLNRGFTEQEFMSMLEKVSGNSFASFFQRFINGVDSLPLQATLKSMNLSLVDLNDHSGTSWTGLNTSFSGGKLTISSIERESPAWFSGLNVNDELIAINQYRLADDLNKYLSMSKPGDTVEFTVSRSGYIRRFPLVLKTNPQVKYVIEHSSSGSTENEKLLNCWLKKKD